MGVGQRVRGLILRMRSRWWALAALLPPVLFGYFSATNTANSHETRLTLAGTPRAFAAAVTESGGAHATRKGLLLDLVFIASWLVVLVPLALTGAAHWLPAYRRGRILDQTWALVLGAGLLDVVEDLLALLFLQRTPSEPAVIVLATVSWLKYLAYVAALAALLFVIVSPTVGSLYRRAGLAVGAVFDRWNGSAVTLPPSRAPVTAAAPEQPHPAVPLRGICVSGGGIRAAGVAIGALTALDTLPDRAESGARSIFRSARWLISVSGGGYAAAGWRLTRQGGDHALQPGMGEDVDGLFRRTGWTASVRTRHRYLDNGFASLTGGVIGAVTRTALVLSAVFATAVLTGWVYGQFLGSNVLHPRFPFSSASPARELDPSEIFAAPLIWPGLSMTLLALLVTVVSYSRIAWAGARPRLALPLAAIGLVLLVLLVGIPFVLRYHADILALATGSTNTSGSTVGRGAGILGWISSLGIVGALTGALKAQAKKRWLRLGGVLLAVMWGYLALSVAYGFAESPDGGRFAAGWTVDGHGVPRLVTLAVVAIAVVNLIASHRLTLAGIYRKRIAQTFALARAADAHHSGRALPPITYPQERPWSDFAAAEGPELIISATVHSSALTVSGLKGYGLTFDPSHVRFYNGTNGGTGASIATSSFPGGSWWHGYPRTLNISRSMAISGAALASAMGRQALGTTQALLAATNLRLGMWLPNPQRAGDFAAPPADRPRVGLVYLAKEILGRYDTARDPFVYVADGGHRDNLGLVDLLRRTPDEVFVIDASGDTPGAFTTLREAIELAEVELQIVIDLDWQPIRWADAFDLPFPANLPPDCVTTGTITYPGSPARTATLYYGRYQLCRRSPRELLAMRARDATFPYYSTGKQFLTSGQFDGLIAMGEFVGTRLREVALASADRPRRSPAPDVN